MGRERVGELLREGAGARVTFADIAMCILGSNPSGGASTSLIARAGAANVVWDSAEWGEFVQRSTGNWIG